MRGEIGLDNLKICYEAIRKILKDKIEPFESVELVNRYREYWRPNVVKVILLGESHLFTNDKDRSITFPMIEGLKNPSEYPCNYARFVYCLAHGERELTGSREDLKNSGTPSFWKIFYSCCNRISTLDDFKPILKKATFGDRLQNKIDVLKRLKRDGVWLVDASIVALYRKGEKPPQSLMEKVIIKSWDYYIKDIIEGCNPKHVICIGKGIAKILDRNLREIVGEYDTIHQPEGLRNFDDYHRYYRLLYYRCNG